MKTSKLDQRMELRMGKVIIINCINGFILLTRTFIGINALRCLKLWDQCVLSHFWRSQHINTIRINGPRISCLDFSRCLIWHRTCRCQAIGSRSSSSKWITTIDNPCGLEEKDEHKIENMETKNICRNYSKRTLIYNRQ